MLLSQAVSNGRVRLRRKLSPWEVELGCEQADARRRVYLITFARVLADRLQQGGLKDVTRLSRQQILNSVLDAWENPLESAAGRPRESDGNLVKKVVVFQELHADGSKHFHVAVLLASQMRFATCKRTLLQRHGLAAHFSCTHLEFWSAVRYGTESTLKRDPDKQPLAWVPRGDQPIDIFEDSQQPFDAPAWRIRRERRDQEAAKEVDAKSSFTKLDFTALVLSKGLRTKAAVMRYSGKEFVCDSWSVWLPQDRHSARPPPP